jgi:cell wall-associated NlpC family hydrolase
MRIALLALLLAGVDPTALERSIQPKLGRPYVWGASGVKSYDCSGFVWRAFLDAGVLLKRTTARKLFYSLPQARGDERTRPGALIFFDQVHHVGIVRSEREFYHASTSRGTRREEFNAYWQRLVSGFRMIRTE